MKVTFKQPFKFSPNGYDIIEYPIGEAEVSARCAEVAEQAGVLEKAKPAKEEKETPKETPKKKKA